MPPNGILGQSLSGGYLQRVPPNATSQQQAVILNNVIDRLNQMLKSQVFSDGQTKRMIIGYQPNGWGDGKDFGMKISVPGVDVTKAKDSELLFKMDMATWYFYDPETRKNFMQMGVLPDGEGGWAVAKDGFNVQDAF